MGLVLGIVGGVVALLVAAVAAFVVVRVNGDAGFPEAEYRLTLPESLLDGEYALKEDFSDSTGGDLERTAENAWNARDVRAAVATYAPTDRGGQLMVTGLYGRFRDADEARGAMLEGAGEPDGSSVAVPPEDFAPSGSDVTVTCQVIAREDLGTRTLCPMCAWNDGNTGALIGAVDPAVMGGEPGEVDLEAFAERTLAIRAELRKPIS